MEQNKCEEAYLGVTLKSYSVVLTVMTFVNTVYFILHFYFQET